jgi:hypothetical protein
LINPPYWDCDTTNDMNHTINIAVRRGARKERNNMSFADADVDTLETELDNKNCLLIKLAERCRAHQIDISDLPAVKLAG